MVIPAAKPTCSRSDAIKYSSCNEYSYNSFGGEYLEILTLMFLKFPMIPALLLKKADIAS